MQESVCSRQNCGFSPVQLTTELRYKRMLLFPKEPGFAMIHRRITVLLERLNYPNFLESIGFLFIAVSIVPPALPVSASLRNTLAAKIC